MTKIFIRDGIIVNVDNHAETQLLTSVGAQELSEEKVAEIFGDKAHLASPLNTKIAKDGTMTFTPPPETPTPTLDQVRTAKQRQIAAAHDAFLKSQSAEYSEMERQTWDSQRTEAGALLADPQAAAPLVRAIANARGMDVVEMARRIQTNTQAWSVLAGHATGQRLKYQDALEVCTTVEEVEAIALVFSLLEAA